MSYLLHNDEPTLVDKLSREELVRQISKVAAKCKPPQVLGVHGDWGAGKTSLLEQVQHRLTGENLRDETPSIEHDADNNHVVTIWFDAWRYQNEPAPVVALLQEMRRQFGRPTKFRNSALKLTEVATRSILYGIDNIAKLIKLEAAPFSPEKIQAAGEKWEKEHLEDKLATDTVQSFLQEAIKALLPDPQEDHPIPRLVIIIDDIDRCNSDAAYRLLEGLKNYLILPNCVFILGMNTQVVTEAISKYMGKGSHEDGMRLRAEAYLEKMCANIWRLPLPKSPATLLAGWISDEAKIIGEAVTAEETKYSRAFLPPNPRRLKALANLLNRMWPTIDLQHKEDDTIYLSALIVAYIYQFHSDIFQRWHYDPNFLEVIQDWVTSGSSSQYSEIYFKGLILPTTTLITSEEAAQVPMYKSSYPDPATPGIFWIAPLLQTRLKELTPTDVNTLLRFEDNQ